MTGQDRASASASAASPQSFNRPPTLASAGGSGGLFPFPVTTPEEKEDNPMKAGKKEAIAIALKARSYYFAKVGEAKGLRGLRETWSASAKRPCPKCQKIDWCLFDEAVAVCQRTESPFPLGGSGWLHVLAPELFEEGASAAKFLADNPGSGSQRIAGPKPPPPDERPHRDAVYRALLGQLPSAAGSEALGELRSSKWGEAALASLAPRLLPGRGSDAGRQEIAALLGYLEERFGRDGLRGVPGFQVVDGQRDDDDPNCWREAGLDGLFPRGAAGAIVFPSVGSDGLVEGLRLRRIGGDGKGQKYWWFSEQSGARPQSASGHPPVAVYKAPVERAATSAILITEGEKKAALAVHALPHLAAAISVPGVTLWAGALAELARIDPEGKMGVGVAYDMDAAGKPEVKRALDSLLQALADAGREKVVVAAWNRARKGLDDILASDGPDAIGWTPSAAKPRWWGRQIDAPATSFRLLPDRKTGGVRVVRVKRNREGEETGVEILASAAYRKIATKRPADGSDPVAVFEVASGGQSRTFEADPGAPNSRDWLRLLRRHAPGEPTLCNNSMTLDALNFIAEAIAKTPGFEPRSRDVHRPGFDSSLDAYRAPGLKIAKEGVIAAEDAEICPEGFGPMSEGVLALSEAEDAEKLREIALAVAEDFHRLFADPMDAAAALACALAGPAVAPLAEAKGNSVLLFEGKTGSGKTTVARLLLRFHGQAKEPADMRNSTDRGAVAYAAEFRDTLCVVDDLQVKRGHLERFAYSAFGGFGRVACRRDGKLATRDKLRGAVIITTEDMEGAAQSMANRLVPIKFEKMTAGRERQARAAAARFVSLGNLSGFGLEAIRRAMSRRETLPSRLNDYLGDLFMEAGGSSRGRDLAALVAVCVEVVGEMLADLLGGNLPVWWTTPGAVARRLLKTHEETEREANPAFRFLNQLETAMLAGGEFAIEEARWTGSPNKITVTSRETDPKDMRGDRTKAWKVAGDYGDCLAVPLERAVAALRIADVSAKAIHTALKAEDLLLRTDAKGQTPRISVAYINGEAGRLRLALIRADAFEGDHFGHVGHVQASDGQNVSKEQTLLEQGSKGSLDTLDTLDTFFFNQPQGDAPLSSPPASPPEKNALETFDMKKRVQRVQAPTKPSSQQRQNVGHVPKIDLSNVSNMAGNVSKDVSNATKATLSSDAGARNSSGSKLSEIAGHFDRVALKQADDLDAQHGEGAGSYWFNNLFEPRKRELESNGVSALEAYKNALKFADDNFAWPSGLSSHPSPTPANAPPLQQ